MFIIKKKLPLIAVIFLSFNVATQAQCYSVLKSLFKRDTGLKNNEAMNFTERVTRIEDFTNFLRKGKDNPDPALNIRIAKKIEKMHEYIFADNFSANEREWRTFFRTMEGKLIGYKRYKQIRDLLEANPRISKTKFISEVEAMGFNREFSDYIASQVKEFDDLSTFKLKLQDEINSTLVDIGNQYQQYRMVRGSLEDLLETGECNDICKKQVNLLLSGLGANSERESLAHPIFFKDQQRPSIDELRELLYQEPLFVLTKAKRERNAELKSFLLSYLNQPEFVDMILGKIYKSNTLGKQKAVQFFKLIYDSQARNVYFPKLNKIIFSKGDAKTNTEILKGVNSTVDQDELLVTFARRIDTLAQEKWKAIKKYAEEFEKEFFEKLTAAEQKAKARGELSPTRDRTLITKLAIFGAAGIGTYSYFYFDSEPTSIEIAIEDNEVPIPGNQGSSNSVDLGEVEPTERGVVPYGVTVNDEDEYEDEKVLLDGPEDEVLDEVTDVMLDSQGYRDPSSVKDSQKGNLFSALWCTLFSCDGD